MQKDFLRDQMKDAIKKRRKKMGPGYDQWDVSVAIREITVEALKRQRQIKREAALQFLKEQTILTQYMGRFADDPGRGARQAWANDPDGARLDSNVLDRSGSLISENNSYMPSLAKLRPRIAGWSVGMKKDFNDNILKELRNIKTGDDLAAQIAKEIRTAIDNGWVQYRRAGGRGGTIDNYLPQKWIDTAVARDRTQWESDVFNALDRDKMRDLDDGHLLDDDEIRDLISEAWVSITTRGANKWADPGIPTKASRSINKRRDQTRILHFTDEGDIALREKYMDPDIMHAVLNYRDSLLHDTATMQILGPNPDKTMKAVTNSIKHRLRKQFDAEKAAGKPPNIIRRQIREKTVNDIEQMHEHVMGRREMIGDSAHRLMDQVDQTVRFGSTALLLGGALVPSMADFATQGLNNMVRGTDMLTRMGWYFKNMANSEQRTEMALTDMIVHDTILNADATAARFMGHGIDRTLGRFGKSAELVLEKSGLTMHTDAGRLAGIRTHQKYLGADVKKKWADLDPRRRGQYESYGITRDDWDAFNKLDLGKVDYYQGTGGYFDFHKARKALPEKDFRRLHEMILHEGQNSTLTTDIRAEKVLESYTFGRHAAPGSIQGVVSSQLRMFKRFPVMAAVMLRETAMNPYTPGWTRAKAIPIWFVSAVMLGGMALQTRQILQGRDPIAMMEDDEINWGFVFAATLYGGGLPFIGDVLPELLGVNTDTLNSKGYHGKSFLDLMPTIGLGRRMLRPFGEAWDQITEGNYEDATRTLGGEAMAEVMRSGAGLFGGNIWYVRAPLDHLIFQQWERLVDPSGFEEKTSRTQDYLEGQKSDFYWLPGQVAPERGPQITR